MRTLATLITVIFMTFTLGPIVLVASLLGVREKPGGLYQRSMRLWSRAVCRVAGVRIVVHDGAGIHERRGAVYIANHVSWFDVLAMAATLPRYSFVAKRELRRIPVFGAACAAAGIVFLDRDNAKQAFQSYAGAAAQVRDGLSVVVYPEGTRGASYALRPFKRGPVVLAIAAGAPVVPTVVHGAREVMPKGSFRIRPGVIHLHFLEPIPTAGLSYDDRGALTARVWSRMAEALDEHYGVQPSRLATSTPNERVV